MTRNLSPTAIKGTSVAFALFLLIISGPARSQDIATTASAIADVAGFTPEVAGQGREGCPPILVTFTVAAPECSGTGVATVTFDPPQGGTPPYSYSIDGFEYQSSPVFSGLVAPSSYTDARVRDALYCYSDPIFIEIPAGNDLIPPVVICRNFTLDLVNGEGTVSAADVDDGSYDNCSFSMNVTPAYFTCANAGDNEVVLTATDYAFNTASCTAVVTVRHQPECSITAVPGPGAYTGAPPEVIYLGYGPQSVTLSCSASGGSGFTYQWSPAEGLSCTDCSAPLFTPTAEGLYPIQVTVTNSNGCTAVSEITVCVLDIRVPNSNSKRVYVCHFLQNNPSNPQTLGVPLKAVPIHVPGHDGDRMGRCDQDCEQLKAGTAGAPTGELIHSELASFAIILFPNPFSNDLEITLESPSESPAEVIIRDLTGRLLEHHVGVYPHMTLRTGATLPDGIYILTVAQDGQRQTMKIMKSR